jgi:hypothetical protein
MINHLRRHLLASTSHMAIARALTAQTQAERNRADAATSTATPPLADRGEPKASQPPPPLGGPPCP